MTFGLLNDFRHSWQGRSMRWKTVDTVSVTQKCKSEADFCLIMISTIKFYLQVFKIEVLLIKISLRYSVILGQNINILFSHVLSFRSRSRQILQYLCSCKRTFYLFASVHWDEVSQGSFKFSFIYLFLHFFLVLRILRLRSATFLAERWAAGNFVYFEIFSEIIVN